MPKGAGGGEGGAIPQIRLTCDEIERYDEAAAITLSEAVTEFSSFNGYIDTDDWGLVRTRKQMRIYRSLQPSDDPRVTLMVGTGLIPGTLDEVMDGVYCETTSDLRAVKTLLKYKFLDGAVLNVTKKRSPEAPFDFAGIKWFAAKAPWGLVQHRDLLTYERMGTVMDDNGNELAYHVLQSIDRPEWPADCVKGVKRERTTTCYLYRRHPNNRVQCFLWGQVYDIGSISRRQRLAEYVVAGTWLNVVQSVRSAEAKKYSALAVSAETRSWPSEGPGFFQSHHTCAGCSQNVCRSCSNNRPIFLIETRTGKPFEERFCKFCVSKVISPPVLPTRHESLYSDPGGRAPTLSSSSVGSRRRTDSSSRRGDGLPLSSAPRTLELRADRRTIDLTDEFGETPPLSSLWI